MCIGRRIVVSHRTPASVPPTGGTQRRLVCDLSRLGSDTNYAIESPVVSADGRLAFLKASSSIGGTNPFRERLAVAPGLDAANATEVQAVPYTPPGEPQRTGVQALRWLDESHLIFVGGLATIRHACVNCVLDTIASGFKVDILSLAGGTVPSPLPGTDQASGVSLGQSATRSTSWLCGGTRASHSRTRGPSRAWRKRRTPPIPSRFRMNRPATVPARI